MDDNGDAVYGYIKEERDDEIDEKEQEVHVPHRAAPAVPSKFPA